jgi:hypothetical protein
MIENDFTLSPAIQLSRIWCTLGCPVTIWFIDYSLHTSSSRDGSERHDIYSRTMAEWKGTIAPLSFARKVKDPLGHTETATRSTPSFDTMSVGTEPICRGDTWNPIRT